MTVTIRPLTGIPEINAGDDLAGMLSAALRPMAPTDGDVLVVTQKVVSKAEGATRPAADEAAYRQIVEEEAEAVLRRRGPLLITVTKHGFVCANAGVDRSNVDGAQVVLLPTDPDRSAHRIRLRLERDLGVTMAVIITDTFGRAWRRGLVDVAIGVSGMLPVLDLRGSADMHGRILEATEVAIADEIAGAAELVTGKARGIPAVLVSGYSYAPGDGRATDLIRPPAEDMFR